ncbi:hypothetical protein [Methylobacterium sp. ARG-1]|uniref:hypothetical protein n=1 Tax=Methylobacterium sp. ARG-1 TaxID=1692501 RepID=UPI0006812B54|nr:hypothetical protein [Methylobacterium sp. ARG-1]KNY22170.1 hypothetical protein AKJ13_13830 [Methylobacterium sp. ARG-1]
MATEPSSGRTVARAGRNPLLDEQTHLRVERLLTEIGPIDWCAVALSNPYASVLRSDRAAMGHARRDLAAIPSEATLDRISAVVAAALSQLPDKAPTAAVAVLFDTMPRQPANPATYLNALCFDLVELRFQPAVVAAACQELRRTATFVPVIGEVIAACRTVQERYVSLQRLTAHAREAHAYLQAAITEAEREPPTRPKPWPRPDAQSGEADR